MLKKIKTALAAFKIINADNTPISGLTEYYVQEHVSTRQAVKRVRKMFDQQQSAINARALKPHSCLDPLSCTKTKCWKWKPDKIVSGEYEVPLKMKTDISMGIFKDDK